MNRTFMYFPHPYNTNLRTITFSTPHFSLIIKRRISFLYTRTDVHIISRQKMNPTSGSPTKDRDYQPSTTIDIVNVDKLVSRYLDETLCPEDIEILFARTPLRGQRQTPGPAPCKKTAFYTPLAFLYSTRLQWSVDEPPISSINRNGHIPKP